MAEQKRRRVGTGGTNLSMGKAKHVILCMLSEHGTNKLCGITQDLLSDKGRLRSGEQFAINDMIRMGYTQALVPLLTSNTTAVATKETCFSWMRIALEHCQPDVAAFLYDTCLSNRTYIDNFRFRQYLTQPSSKPMFGHNNIHCWKAVIRATATFYCGLQERFTPNAALHHPDQCVQRFIQNMECMEKFLAIPPCRNHASFEEQRFQIRRWVYEMNTRLFRSEQFCKDLLHQSLKHAYTLQDLQLLHHYRGLFAWNTDLDPRLIPDMHKILITCIMRDDIDMFRFMEEEIILMFNVSGSPEFCWSEIADLKISPWFYHQEHAPLLQRLGGTYKIELPRGEEITYKDYAQFLYHRNVTSKLYWHVMNKHPDHEISLLGHQIRLIASGMAMDVFMRSIPARHQLDYTNIQYWHHVLADVIFVEQRYDLFANMTYAFHGWNDEKNVAWMYGNAFTEPELYRFVQIVRSTEPLQPAEHEVVLPPPVPQLVRDSSSSSSGLFSFSSSTAGGSSLRRVVTRFTTTVATSALHESADMVTFGGVVQQATFLAVLYDVSKKSSTYTRYRARRLISSKDWEELRTSIDGYVREHRDDLYHAPVIFPTRMDFLEKQLCVSLDMICSYMRDECLVLRQIPDPDDRSMVVTNDVHPTLMVLFSSLCSSIMHRVYQHWYQNPEHTCMYKQPYTHDEVVAVLKFLFPFAATHAYHPLIAENMEQLYPLAYFTAAFLALVTCKWEDLKAILVYHQHNPEFHRGYFQRIHWDLMALAFELGHPTGVRILFTKLFMQDNETLMYPGGWILKTLRHRCHAKEMFSMLEDWRVQGMKSQDAIEIKHDSDMVMPDSERDMDMISILWPESIF